MKNVLRGLQVIDLAGNIVRTGEKGAEVVLRGSVLLSRETSGGAGDFSIRE